VERLRGAAWGGPEPRGRPTSAITHPSATPPCDEGARELYRCYRELGDLAARVGEDRHLRQALRETLCDPGDPEDDPERYQPEPETVAQFGAVRAELEGRRGNRSG
jgi:hypothetical protein